MKLIEQISSKENLQEAIKRIDFKDDEQVKFPYGG